MLKYRPFFNSKSTTKPSDTADVFPAELPGQAQAAEDAGAIIAEAYPSPAVSQATPTDLPVSAAKDVLPAPQSAPFRIDGLDQFDEAFYLKTHEDVASAVARGDWHSGLMHYAVAGRAKGRTAWPDVDTGWYEATYPAVQSDIAAGRAADAEDHYHRLGRYRGYLPFESAPRPDDAAKCRSRYGGLWTDHGNALDVIEGRLDLGYIDEGQAQLLRDWVTRGYVILPQAIPEDILAAAATDLDRAYSGLIPDMRFAVHGIGQHVRWVPEAQTNPAKALDLHWHSEATRNLIFAPDVLDFLHLIFERRSLASQTLGFWRGSQQDGHQDSAYVNYSLPMQFAASWIALEDVHEGAGELFYHEGSHRIAEYRFQGSTKGVEEVARVGNGGPHIDAQIKEHIERISLQSAGLGLSTGRLMARRGDALIWAADLAHGGSVISGSRTRKSIVAHYCPANCAPSYFEQRSSQIQKWQHQAFYSSSHYGRSNKLD